MRWNQFFLCSITIQLQHILQLTQCLRKYVQDIIGRHGCPAKILSDQGSHFKNRMVEQLVQKFEIKHLFSTPYYPQTNGLVERFNRTLCESLAKLSPDNENMWDKHIQPVLFAYRTTPQSTTKMTPFYLVYGREAKLPIDSPELEEEGNLIERIRTIIDQLPEERETTKVRIEKAQLKQKERHD